MMDQDFNYLLIIFKKLLGTRNMRDSNPNESRRSFAKNMELQILMKGFTKP